MIIVVGDIHGEFDKFMRKIIALELRDCLMIQAGDFGVGFKEKNKELHRLSSLNLHLQKRNIFLKAIRGNHDNPAYFDGSIKYSNLELLKDYSVIRFEIGEVNIDDRVKVAHGINILCVGGAISIDRNPNPDIIDLYGRPWMGRESDKNYWKDEAFGLNLEAIEEIDVIDYVVTHSAPNFCEPHIKETLLEWLPYDGRLNEDVDRERNDHAKLYDKLKSNLCPLKKWYYGHFHNNYLTRFEDVDFIGLDIDEFAELRY